MKTLLRSSVCGFSFALAAACLPTAPVYAAPPAGATNAAPRVETNAVPRSVYTTEGGRDPFFPSRNMGPSRPVVAATNTHVSAPVTLTIKGMSPGYAIINGKTVAVGEITEVPTSAGRMLVHCLEVRLKDNTVVVEVDGERQELHGPE